MAATQVRRQLLLFLFGVLIPGVVLLVFGLMLIRQEGELSQRRDADALSVRARTIAESLEAWLEAGYEATNDSLQAGEAHRRPVNQQTVLTGSYSDGVYRDARLISLSPHPLSSPEHTDFGRSVERQEFMLDDPSGAIRTLQARISVESDSTRITDLRIRLARILFANEKTAQAVAQARLAMQQDIEIADEFGTPLALYAAELLISAERPEGVCDKLVPFASTKRWLTEGAGGYLLDLEQRAGCPSNPSLATLLEEIRVAGLIAVLGERLIADRRSERWIALDINWFVRRIDGDRREAEAVVAVSLGDIAVRLASLGIDSVSVVDTSLPLGERDRLLAPEFKSLRASFPPVVSQLISRRTFYFLAVLFVVLMTLVGGYLMWRDLRRESRLMSLQSQFVASVSHELRTPLTSIRLFSEAMLEYDSVDPDERKKGLRVIAHESARLSRMLNNVLSTTRVERGTMTYQKTPGDLADAAENAIEAMRHEYDEANITIERELAMARGDFDPDTIEQAVLNLLSNALKYASSGGRVVVRSWEEGGHASISVRDFGPGIELKEQDHVFERFYRISGNGQTRMPGAGLGLALIRHIAAGHGGAVLLDSEPGAGCHFTIQLPLYA